MKGDFSRITRDPKKGYSRVLKEQGRVNTDADWNEQVEIALRRVREQAKDVIGLCGVPESDDGENGFKIVETNGALALHPGVIYVDGILCELHDTDAAPIEVTPGSDGEHLLYLDVWEELVTGIDDEDLVDEAIGVPTSDRTRSRWAVRAKENGDAPLPTWPGNARLSTKVNDTADSEPCSPIAGGGYVGLENRLYRVEIQTGGTAAGGATFKWSRDNASTAYAIKNDADGGTPIVKLSMLGRDARTTLKEDDIVEYVDDDTDKVVDPGTLTRVSSIAEAADGYTVTLVDEVPCAPLAKHPRLIRWDHPLDQTTGNAIPITEGSDPEDPTHWIGLEKGIAIQFATDRTYQAGDYWVFWARASTGSVEILDAAEPHGVRHHYCKLASATWESNEDGGTWALDEDDDDLRQTFPPLTDIEAKNITIAAITECGDFGVTVQDALAAICGRLGEVAEDGDADGDGIHEVKPGLFPPKLNDLRDPQNIVSLSRFAEGVEVEFKDGVTVNSDTVNRFTFYVTLEFAEGGEIASDRRTCSFSDFHALGEIIVAYDNRSAVFRPAQTILNQLHNLHYYCGIPGPSGYWNRYVPCRVTLKTRHILDDDGSPIGTRDHEEWFLIKHEETVAIGITFAADRAAVPAEGGDVVFAVTMTNTSAKVVTVNNLVDDRFGAVPDFEPVTLAPGESRSYTLPGHVDGDPDSLHTNTITAACVDSDGNSLEWVGSADIRIAEAPPPPPPPTDRIYVIPNAYHPALINLTTGEADEAQQVQLLEGLSLGLDRAALRQQLPQFAFADIARDLEQADALLRAVLGTRLEKWDLYFVAELQPIADQMAILLKNAASGTLPVNKYPVDDAGILLNLRHPNVYPMLAILSDETLRYDGKSSIDALCSSLSVYYKVSGML